LTGLGDLLLRQTRELRRQGQTVCALGRSRILFRLLEVLGDDSPPLDRGALYERVWELPYRPPSSDNTLYVALTRLRDRLKETGVEIVATPAGG